MPIQNLREIVKERLIELRLRPITAARAAGLERGFINDILKDRKRDLRGDNLVKLAAVLQLDPGMLAQGIAAPTEEARPALGEVGDGQTTPKGAATSASARQRGVPVRGTAAGALAHSFRFTGDIVEEVPWPPALAGVKGLYAIFVARNSMEPEHKAGELRFVNPNRPPRPGDAVVVTTRTHEGAAPESYIGRFLRQDDKQVVIAKLNPPSNVKFEIAYVLAVEKVMTTNELFGV